MHIDLDAFYCAVEAERDPALRGVPLGVVQYDPREGARGAGVVDRPMEAVRRNVGAAGPTGSGSLIAVSYEARARGVKRGMRNADARLACPALELVQVPTRAGKSDMQVYRDAGARVVEVLRRHCPGAALEKASVDESYMDLTAAAQRLLREEGTEAALRGAAGTHVAGWEGSDAARKRSRSEGSGEESGSEEGQAAEGRARARVGGALPGRASVRGGAGPSGAAAAGALTEYVRRDGGDAPAAEELLLAAGCAVAARLRAAVRSELGYSCSAGVSQNKLLAKLGSGLHKPNQQTALFPCAVPALLRGLPVDRLRGLGGKLGERVKALGVATAGELAERGAARLRREFGERTGGWLHALATGNDVDEVKDRSENLSLSNGKRFDHRSQLRSFEHVEGWLRSLLEEVARRAEAERDGKGRAPRTLTVSVSSEHETNATGATSRSCPFRFGAENLLADATRLVRGWAEGLPPGQADGPCGLGVKSLFVAASNFHALPPAPSQGRGLEKFLRPSTAGGRGPEAAAPTALTAPTAPTAPAAVPAPDNRKGALDRFLSLSGPCGAEAQSGSGPGTAPQRAPHYAYEASEIDEAVLRELPEDIRREVLQAAGRADPEDSVRRKGSKRKAGREAARGRGERGGIANFFNKKG